MFGGRYETPSIVSQHTAPYNEDDASAYAASSLSLHEERHREMSLNDHPQDMATPVSQASILSPMSLSIIQPSYGYTPQQQVMIPAHHSSHQSHHDHHSSHRARSRHSAPLPISVPPDYRPASPGMEVSPRRGRMPVSSAHQHTTLESAISLNPADGGDLSRSLNAVQTYPANGARGVGSPYSEHHSRHRSSSQHPLPSSHTRPAYTRQRSKSYEPPPVSRARYDNWTQPYSGAAQAGGYGGSPYGYGQAIAYGTTKGANYETMHASATSPTIIYPSTTHPLIVPINEGRDGWVVIPGKGQKLQVINEKGQPYSSNSSSSNYRDRGHQSFFGWLNKGFGGRSRSKTITAPVHVGIGGVQQFSVMTTGNSPSRRIRRDSY